MQNDLLPRRPFMNVSGLTSTPLRADHASRSAVARLTSAIRKTPVSVSAQVSRRIATTLARTARAATAGALKFWRAYIRAMHESRRREAAMFVALRCPDLDPADFMYREYGIETKRDRRRHGPLSDEEIAFLKTHAKTDD
jgi:hypothetical protein